MEKLEEILKAAADFIDIEIKDPDHGRREDLTEAYVAGYKLAESMAGEKRPFPHEKAEAPGEYQWNVMAEPLPGVSEGDVRVVVLPVKVLFGWSDNIVADEDEETGEVLETFSGYVMEVLPDQKFLYEGEDTQLLFNTRKEHPPGQ